MKTGNQKGLSLVEVILALGLLATVLISVAGLYVLSERQVESGKSTTEATAVARTIIEEMDAWGFRQTYTFFGYDGSATNYTVDSRAHADAAKWQAVLDETLGAGISWAEIEIRSIGPSGVTIPNLNETRAIRVSITVHWSEGLRQREVQLESVRF